MGKLLSHEERELRRGKRMLKRTMIERWESMTDEQKKQEMSMRRRLLTMKLFVVCPFCGKSDDLAVPERTDNDKQNPWHARNDNISAEAGTALEIVCNSKAHGRKPFYLMGFKQKFDYVNLNPKESTNS